MNRIALVSVCVVLVGCDPSTSKGPVTPQPGASPAPLQCAPVAATRIDGPNGLAFYNLSYGFVLRLAACAPGDLAQLQQAVAGCTSQNGCGVPIDPAAFTDQIAQLQGVQVEHARVGDTAVDVYRPQASTVFVFSRAANPAAVIGGLAAQPTLPGSGGSTPLSGAVPVIPCCPTCAWCHPGVDPQCPGVTPPPPPPPPNVDLRNWAGTLVLACGAPTTFCDAFKRAGSPADCQCAVTNSCH